MIFLTVIFDLIVLFVLFWQGSLLLATIWGAPTVYANREAILAGLKLANLQKGDLIVDLGCGDGRALILAANKFGVKGVGVDRSFYCYLLASLRVLLSGEKKRVKIIWGDFKKAEPYLKKADAVYLYLLISVMKQIEPWLFSLLKPEAKVVSLSFKFPNRKIVKSAPTRNLGRQAEVYLYKVKSS